MEVIDAAKRNDVFLMEAFMYRCQPQIQKLVELIREKAIGEVRMIRATFSFPCDFDPKSRIFDKDLGGGGHFGRWMLHNLDGASGGWCSDGQGIRRSRSN